MASSIEKPFDSATEFSTLQFVVQSMLARMGTATLVRVDSCTNNGGLAAWGTVNVQPLVSQVSGDGTAVPHGKLFRLPYLRIQGGANAFIIDPAPGDIGLAVFNARDISSLKAQSAIDQVKGGAQGVTPASKRQFSMADGVYIGGYLNSQPTQYVRMGTDEIEIVSPTKIVLRAPEVEINASISLKATSPDTEFTANTMFKVTSPDIELTGPVTIAGTLAQTGGGAATMSGSLTVSGAVTGQGTNLHAHEHSGVQPGSGTSGPPV